MGWSGYLLTYATKEGCTYFGNKFSNKFGYKKLTIYICKEHLKVRHSHGKSCILQTGTQPKQNK